MRPLLFLAGGFLVAMGFVAEARIGNPGLLQGALTLGGGWIICGLFSLRSRWHGVIGAGVLALLGAARCAPALIRLGEDPSATWETAAFVASAVVLVSVVRSLLAERARQTREALLRED